MSRAATFVLILALLALGAAAGCGTGEPDDGSHAEKRRIVEADAAWTERNVLRAADLPPGWRPEPAEERVEPEECDAIDYSDLTITGESTATFAPRGETMFLGHELYLYETERQARTALARGDEDDVTACLRELLDEELDSGASGIALERVVALETDGLDVGEPRRGFRIEATLREATETLPASVRTAQPTLRVVFFTTVFVRGRALSAVAYGSFGSEFPTGIAAEAAAAIDKRMRTSPPPG